MAVRKVDTKIIVYNNYFPFSIAIVYSIPIALLIILTKNK